MSLHAFHYIFIHLTVASTLSVERSLGTDDETVKKKNKKGLGGPCELGDGESGSTPEL